MVDDKRPLTDPKVPESKKAREDSPLELVVPLLDDDFSQLKEYYSEALENMESEPTRATELIQVTINEADRLLREHYETSPQLFDGDFYLVFGCSLFFLSQMTEREANEELEFLELALDRLKTSIELSEDSLEAKLALSKTTFHKAGMLMQSACQASEEVEQTMWTSASVLLDEAAPVMEAIINTLFHEKATISGQFVEPIQEALCVLEHAQLLADREVTWKRCSLMNRWCQKLFQIILDSNLSNLKANLGLAACLLSMANFYFDHAPQDDSDSDDEEEEDPDVVALISEMNPSKVGDYLTKANEHLDIAIDLLDDSSIDMKSRAFIMRGEANLNLGNLASDEEKESEYYQKTVEAFQTAKKYHPEGLLPDSFESFLEEWAHQF